MRTVRELIAADPASLSSQDAERIQRAALTRFRRRELNSTSDTTVLGQHLRGLGEEEFRDHFEMVLRSLCATRYNILMGTQLQWGSAVSPRSTTATGYEQVAMAHGIVLDPVRDYVFTLSEAYRWNAVGVFNPSMMATFTAWGLDPAEVMRFRSMGARMPHLMFLYKLYPQVTKLGLDWRRLSYRGHDDGCTQNITMEAWRDDPYWSSIMEERGIDSDLMRRYLNLFQKKCHTEANAIAAAAFSVYVEVMNLPSPASLKMATAATKARARGRRMTPADLPLAATWWNLTPDDLQHLDTLEEYRLGIETDRVNASRNDWEMFEYDDASFRSLGLKSNTVASRMLLLLGRCDVSWETAKHWLSVWGTRIRVDPDHLQQSILSGITPELALEWFPADPLPQLPV